MSACPRCMGIQSVVSRHQIYLKVTNFAAAAAGSHPDANHWPVTGAGISVSLHLTQRQLSVDLESTACPLMSCSSGSDRAFHPLQHCGASDSRKYAQRAANYQHPFSDSSGLRIFAFTFASTVSESLQDGCRFIFAYFAHHYHDHLPSLQSQTFPQ